MDDNKTSKTTGAPSNSISKAHTVNLFSSESINACVESLDARFERAKKILAENSLPVDRIEASIETIIRSSCYLQDVEYESDTVKDIIISLGNSITIHRDRSKRNPSYVKIASTDVSSVNFNIVIKVTCRNSDSL